MSRRRRSARIACKIHRADPDTTSKARFDESKTDWIVCAASSAFVTVPVSQVATVARCGTAFSMFPSRSLQRVLRGKCCSVDVRHRTLGKIVYSRRVKLEVKADWC